MSLAVLVTSLTLPFGALWANLAPAGGKLLVWGPANPGHGCVFVAVDPVSLHAARSRRSCWFTTGRLEPVFQADPRSQTQRVTVAGRPAFAYSDASDTKPVWTYGGGSLWLYDVATERGPELLRYSTRTGHLLQRVPFPRLFRPVLAANTDGAWLMAATSGGVSGARTAALYHVAPGAKRPAVVQRGARAALWMTATAHTLWLETVTGTSTFRLWRYDGGHGRLLWRLHRIVVGSATYGSGALWGVAPACGGRAQVVKLDAGTGARSVVASVPVSDCYAPSPGAFFRGAFWFVDGNKLFRITS